MHRLSESGIRVPEDMSIIGFGDIEASSYISPALTTIAQNSREMGARCSSGFVAAHEKTPAYAVSKCLSVLHL